MTVKSSISLTDQQDTFARSLVENGRYASMSAVISQGLELLRERIEIETAERDALRLLIEERQRGEFVSSDQMRSKVEAMIARKRGGGAL